MPSKMSSRSAGEREKKTIPFSVSVRGEGVSSVVSSTGGGSSLDEEKTGTSLTLAMRRSRSWMEYSPILMISNSSGSVLNWYGLKKDALAP